MRNEAVIERFYEELWDRWDLGVADETVSENISFRGSLGSTLEGREAFKDYVRTVRASFPDRRNRVDEVIVSGDRVVTRMTWSGTQRGELLGIEPMGRRVEYVGVAIFRVTGGKIEDGWVVDDTQELWRALGRLRAPPGKDGRWIPKT